VQAAQVPDHGGDRWHQPPGRRGGEGVLEATRDNGSTPQGGGTGGWGDMRFISGALKVFGELPRSAGPKRAPRGDTAGSPESGRPPHASDDEAARAATGPRDGDGRWGMDGGPM